MKKGLILLIICLLLSASVEAGKRPPRQPVHLDGSGRPMVNSWQENEYKRHQTKQVITAQPMATACKVQANGQVDPNCKTVSPASQETVTVVETTTAPTPTSVIVNRPIQVNVAPTSTNQILP